MYLTLLVWAVSWTLAVNGPVMPLYVESLGISVFNWGLLAASIAFGMFLLEWVWGVYYDRIDPRLLMVLSVLALSVLYPLYTVQFLIPYFIVLQFLAGAIGIAVGPISRAYVSDVSSPNSVGFFVSLWWAFFILGRTIGPLLGSFIAQVWGYHQSFYASTLLSIATALLILLTFPKRNQIEGAGRPIDLASGLKQILRTHSVGYLFISALFAFMGVALIRSFLPLYASEQVRMSTLDVGVLISATSAAQLLAMPVMGWTADRFGKRRLILLGFSLSALVFLLYLFVGTQSQLMLVSLIVSVGLSASSLLLLALIPDVSPNGLHGAVVGVYGSFEDLGLIIGPVIFGLVWSLYTPILIFAAGAIAQVAGAIFLIPIFRRHVDRTVDHKS